MELRFDIATIIGAGLLGASLGLALKDRELAQEVRGVGHRPASLDTAKAVGAIDAAYLDPVEAVQEADLIVVCTPAALVIQMLDAIQPHCRPEAVVTDVASTKAILCIHAAHTWPAPRRFVGSHPMAGSEKFGAAHARPDLYEGTVTLMETLDGHDPMAYSTVKALWEAVGSRTVVVSPEQHDRIVARTSHIPHIVAGCLALVASGNDDIQPFVGKGFRDTTRVAAGRPDIWRDICLTNEAAIAAGIDAMMDELGRIRAMVENKDGEELARFFSAAQEARQKALGE